MILIAYDGSDDAKSAIVQAAHLVPGHPAIVTTVWEPYICVLNRHPPPGALLIAGDCAEIDSCSRTAAEERAAEGAGPARSRGLEAGSRAVARRGSIAQSLLPEADRMNASAIVVGSRGLGGLGSLFLGSVSWALIQHADPSVVIVLSPKAASRRNEKLTALSESMR